MNAGTIAPVRKTVTVARTQTDAFAIFTEQLGSWWPLQSHSIDPARVVTAIMEPRHGGRVFERWEDVSEHDWGKILIWEPPHRFVMTWHPGSDHVTEVEVRFSPTAEGTLVELEHRHWERLGEDGPRLRAAYDSGWPGVLRRFAVDR